jgi:hypothetical protein
MKFFRIDLLTLLISLFILNSCKNQDTVGFTLGTKGTLSGSLVDTATIFTKTTTDDSVVTSAITKSPLGYINDPVFGTTQADLITDLNLPGSVAYTLPAGTITIDSAVLILKYTQGFYGDSSAHNTSKYVVNVYQLAQKQASGGTYYSNTVWPHQGTVIGSTSMLNYTFAPRPNTKVVIDSAVSGKPDVPDTIPPQIRIPISKNFINSALFGASSAELNSNQIFQNTVKGLYITVDKTQSTGVGGIMMVSGADSLAVYIRSASGTVIDTAVVYLPTTQYFSYIHAVRSTVFQNAITNKTTLTDTTVYLQGLAGSRVKVSFPYIDSLFSNRNVGGVNNVIVNRAELVVTMKPVSGDIPGYLTPLPRLSLYMLDIAHQRIELPDASGLSTASGVEAFGGFYSSIYTKPINTYHFLVTSYLQNLITKRLVDYGTYLAPTDTTNLSSVDVTPSAQVAARTVAGGGYSHALSILTPSNPQAYSMRLNVIYTKIK